MRNATLKSNKNMTELSLQKVTVPKGAALQNRVSGQDTDKIAVLLLSTSLFFVKQNLLNVMDD